MLELVRVSRLSKERHSAGSQEKRIGRGEAQILHELQQRKDRFVNTLKRHLSPRGSGPRRKVDIRILENQSISPEISLVDPTWDTLYPLDIAKLSPVGSGPHREMAILWGKQPVLPKMDLVDSTLNELYPVGIAELSSGSGAYPLELNANIHQYMNCAETPPPVYNQPYFGSAQSTPAELGSEYYSAYDAQPPAMSQYQLVELDGGEGFSKSSEYVAQLQLGPAELSTNDNTTCMPQHSAYGSFQIAELDTNDNLAYTAWQFQHSNNSIAELDTNDDLQCTAEDFTRDSSGIAELGTNDALAYTAQHFAHGSYGVTELSTDNGQLYATDITSALALQPQLDHSPSDASSPEESLNDWCHMTPSSSPPLPVVGPPDLDHIHCEQFRSNGASRSSDLNGSTPLVPQYGYPASYYASSPEDGVSPDSLSGISWLSSTPSLLSQTTSISSLEFNTTPVDNSHDPGRLFFDESGVPYSVPIEMESLPSTMKDQPHQSPNATGNWEARLDQDISIYDFRARHLPHPTDISLQKEQVPSISEATICYPHISTQLKDQSRISRKPVQSPRLDIKASSPPLLPDIQYSTRHEYSIPNIPRSAPVRTKVAIECTYCHRDFNDKSNLRRHQLICKRNPLKSPTKYTCTYSSCGKEFARADGLRFHQKSKGHEQGYEWI